MDLTILTIFAFAGAILKCIFIMSNIDNGLIDVTAIEREVTAQSNGVATWSILREVKDKDTEDLISQLICSNGVRDYLERIGEENVYLVGTIIKFLFQCQDKCLKHIRSEEIQDYFAFNAPYSVELIFKSKDEIHMLLYDHKENIIFFDIKHIELEGFNGITRIYLEAFFPTHPQKEMTLCFMKER